MRQRYVVVTPVRGEERSIELRMGELHHFLGYRWLYMLVRSLRSAVQDLSRGSGGVALLLGDLRAALRRTPRFDADYVAWVRNQQLARFNRSHLRGYLAATRCRSNV